jgi:DNA polymerase-3 subunit beta
LSEGKVELVVKDEVLEIRAEGKSTSIKGMVATEFPLIPKLAKEISFRLEAEGLRQAINQVAFAVSASDSRPELGGVACYFNPAGVKETLVMAATDSYRLAERQITLAAGVGADVEKKCIIPARAMQEVSRILSGYKDEVGMPQFVEWSITESQLAVTFGNVEMVSRLIEGSFPDYKQIIPKQFRTNCRVKRTELMKAIRAASLFSRQGIYDVHFELSTEGMLTISSADTGTGAHTAKLHAVVEGESNKVTLNFKYMNDGLGAMETDFVVLHVIDAMNAVVVKPADKEGFQYVVMPIRQ